MCKAFYLFIVSGVLLAGAGCTLLPPVKEKEVVLYDLCQKDERSTAKLALEAGAFSDLTGNGSRMAVREKDGSLHLDSTHRFTVSPAQLLRRKMALFFAAPGEGASKTVLTGTLLRFEYLREQKEVRMVCSYTLRSEKAVTTLLHDLQVKVRNGESAEIAAAFEEVFLISARRLAGEMEVWKKQLEKGKK